MSREFSRDYKYRYPVFAVMPLALEAKTGTVEFGTEFIFCEDVKIGHEAEQLSNWDDKLDKSQERIADADAAADENTSRFKNPRDFRDHFLTVR